MVSGSVAMILIYLNVRKIEATTVGWSTRLHQQIAEPSAILNNSDDNRPALSSTLTINNSNNNTTSRRTSTRLASTRFTLADLPRTRRVFHQGLGYTFAFVFLYIFPTTSRIFQTTGNVPPYPIRLLAVTMVTSQGFWNWVVYYLQPQILNHIERRRRHGRRISSTFGDRSVFSDSNRRENKTSSGGRPSTKSGFVIEEESMHAIGTPETSTKFVFDKEESTHQVGTPSREMSAVSPDYNEEESTYSIVKT
jgi:hypothetical protein